MALNKMISIRRHWKLLSGLVILTVIGWSIYASKHQPASWKFGYVQYKDDKFDAYLINGDGTGIYRLTNDGEIKNFDDFLTNSMIFTFGRDYKRDIYIVDNDSKPKALTTDKEDDFSPSVSPDGRQIIFSSNRDGNYELYLMNIDGSNQRRLTNTQDDEINPSWSPVGKEMAFAIHRSLNGTNYSSINIMNIDGSGLRSLTGMSTNDFAPDWLPDGQKLIFVSTRDGNSHIYIMNKNGSNPQRLTDGGEPDSYPRVSPDGSSIVFERSLGEIWTMNIDGSNQRHVIGDNSNYVLSPVWLRYY
ncbi:MAG: PD40 domain-containing protein [Anaerolineae bacterium]|nr:PD40 domain-containing protein [Anaerolineae bacterium]